MQFKLLQRVLHGKSAFSGLTLRYLALIVRGADTDRHDLTPESGGLFAISLGLSDLHPGDDQAVLRDGFIVYDALYRWLKFCRSEKHLWFPPASKLATAS